MTQPPDANLPETPCRSLWDAEQEALDAFATLNEAIEEAAREAGRIPPADLTSWLQPRPNPWLTTPVMLSISYSAMLGALLGWLAPALVTAAIIVLLLLANWWIGRPHQQQADDA